VTWASGQRWSLADRARDLEAAARDGVDLLVVGGGITGAGVLRDAATRGMRALVIERGDFAAGTSGSSSKMIHGGLRYIGEGQIATTREACRERDRLLRLAPQLVRPRSFLFPAYEGSKIPLWQVRAVLSIYAALANFRRSARFRMLGPDEVPEFSRDLRTDELRGAGLYTDAQVDDARLVLDTLKGARSLGCAAVNHAEVVEFQKDAAGQIRGARVRDALSCRSIEIRADVIVNAAGPAVERVRGIDRPVPRPELRPAKGVHLVIPRHRIHVEAAITFEAADRRHLFLIPWDDVALLGTTDTFSDEIDDPVVTIEEVHYLLDAVNDAFPRACLTTNDLRSVFAGVRPLAASPSEDKPPSRVSREHRIYEDPSGLVSAAGGKLTTYRAMGEAIVDRAIRRLPAARRAQLGPSRTVSLPLRSDAPFDRGSFEAELCERFRIQPKQSAHLVRTYGAQALDLLAEARPEEHRPIGASRNTLAEIAWSFRTECPATLCDLLERRLRMAIFAVGQGLPELPLITRTAAEAAGWDEERAQAEAMAYADAVRRRYQIVAPVSAPARSAA
jgi:glycerol-3-phosphate dehydrogenase